MSIRETFPLVYYHFSLAAAQGNIPVRQIREYATQEEPVIDLSQFTPVSHDRFCNDLQVYEAIVGAPGRNDNERVRVRQVLYRKSENLPQPWTEDRIIRVEDGLEQICEIIQGVNRIRRNPSEHTPKSQFELTHSQRSENFLLNCYFNTDGLTYDLEINGVRPNEQATIDVLKAFATQFPRRSFHHNSSESKKTDQYRFNFLFESDLPTLTKTPSSPKSL